MARERIRRYRENFGGIRLPAGFTEHPVIANRAAGAFIQVSGMSRSDRIHWTHWDRENVLGNRIRDGEWNEEEERWNEEEGHWPNGVFLYHPTMALTRPMLILTDPADDYVNDEFPYMPRHEGSRVPPGTVAALGGSGESGNYATFRMFDPKVGSREWGITVFADELLKTAQGIISPNSKPGWDIEDCIQLQFDLIHVHEVLHYYWDLQLESYENLKKTHLYPGYAKLFESGDAGPSGFPSLIDDGPLEEALAQSYSYDICKAGIGAILQARLRKHFREDFGPGYNEFEKVLGEKFLTGLQHLAELAGVSDLLERELDTDLRRLESDVRILLNCPAYLQWGVSEKVATNASVLVPFHINGVDYNRALASVPTDKQGSMRISLRQLTRHPDRRTPLHEYQPRKMVGSSLWAIRVVHGWTALLERDPSRSVGHWIVTEIAPTRDIVNRHGKLNRPQRTVSR